MKLTYPLWSGWPGNRTAIIAEVGVNHGGDEGLAWEMIQAAHESGADFVKIQSFMMEEFLHPSLPYYHATKGYELSFEQQKKLFHHARKEGIQLISTPFDAASAAMVDQFNPPAHKVASMDANNILLIRALANMGKPVLISNGMADLGEVQKAVEVMQQAGNEKLVLLHCVSDYPTNPADLHLASINMLHRTFGRYVGLSDHSLGLHSSFYGASMGVAVIEKHFTTDKQLHDKYPDADNNISILPEELAELRKFCELLKVMVGTVPRPFTENEMDGRKKFRRGLYAKRDISPGEKLSEENVAFLRPTAGLSVGLWDEVKDRVFVKAVAKLQPIFYSDLGL